MNKPAWWPQNPFPEDIFPMTIKDYVRLVPNPQLRTALTGCLGRLFWDIAATCIWEAMQKAEEEKDE